MLKLPSRFVISLDVRVVRAGLIGPKQYWWICEVFYSPATAMLKVSVGLFLLRIVVKKIQRWIVYFFMAGSIVFGSFWLLITIFQCKPVSFWWDLNPEAHGTCINATVFTICAYIVSLLNGTADFVFALLPIFMLRDSNMSKRTRYMVCGLLSVASMYVPPLLQESRRTN